MIRQYELGNSKWYNSACAPSEDLDQPAHMRRLIRVLARHSIGRTILHTDSNGSDQTAWMGMLVRVFGSQTCIDVHFVVTLLNAYTTNESINEL